MAATLHPLHLTRTIAAALQRTGAFPGLRAATAAVACRDGRTLHHVPRAVLADLYVHARHSVAQQGLPRGEKQAWRVLIDRLEPALRLPARHYITDTALMVYPETSPRWAASGDAVAAYLASLSLISNPENRT